MYEFLGVTFHPWVGAHYGRESRFRVRLLLLGESHYDEDPELSDCAFTQAVVREWGQEQRASFFTVIAKVLRGNAGGIDDAARSEIWEHTALLQLRSERSARSANAPHISAVVRSADSVRDCATEFETRRCPDTWPKAVGACFAPTTESHFRGDYTSVERSFSLCRRNSGLQETAV